MLYYYIVLYFLFYKEIYFVNKIVLSILIYLATNIFFLKSKIFADST